MTWTDPRTWTDGELVTASLLNAHLRDNLDALGEHLIVRKTADESVTSSTTVQDDNELILPVLANEVWLFHLYVRVISGGDFQCCLTFPAGGEMSARFIGSDPAGVMSEQLLSGSASPTPTRTYNVSASNAQILPIEGIFVTGGTAGNVTLQWAQSASNPAPATVKANSTLWGRTIP